MTDPVDPFEALRHLNPVDGDELRDAGDSPQATETLARILSGSPREHRPRRRVRARRLFGAILLPAVAAIVGLAVWRVSESSTPGVTVRCFERASLNARSIDVLEHGRSPTLTCSSAWSNGSVGGGPVPRLQACVLASGKIGVFPREGGSVCSRLGLAPK